MTNTIGNKPAVSTNNAPGGLTHTQLVQLCSELKQSIVVANHLGHVVYDNNFASQLFDAPVHCATLRDYSRLLHKQTRSEVFSHLRHALRHPGQATVTLARIATTTQAQCWVEISFAEHLIEPNAKGILISARPSSSKQHHSDEHFDPLTGLPNRRSLIQRLSALSVQQTSYSLLYVDLDFFKTINDQFGHDVGDQLLIQMADRLAANLRKQDVLTRLGGDEFVVLRVGEDTEFDAGAAAEALIRALNEPMIIGGNLVKVEASIGVAIRPSPAPSPQDMVRNADVAMYTAKRKGRNQVAFFDDNMRARASRQAGISNALQFALERDEFDVVFQPKYRLSDMTLIGAEALLRWQSSDFGNVSPAEFIPIAEQSSIIRPIGRFVMQKACEHLARWQQSFEGAQHLHIAVNVSTKQLLVDEFVDELQATLQSTGIDPSCLEIEVTESAVMDNPVQSQMTLVRLKALGVRIALDDFGTGYSSLAYVRRLPLDVIKIDRSFVMGLSLDDSDSEVIRTILAFAQSLGLDTVAEGVESERVATELRALGCSIGQGYLFSKPLTATSMRYMLADNLPAALANVAA
jgi:diguanylate cyclase (GGDEF)-like protein